MHDEKNEARAARLIGLKRYETPGEAYFERFMTDFRERQRAEILRLSAPRLFQERLATWFSCLPTGARLAGLAAGTAAALIAAFWMIGTTRSDRVVREVPAIEGPSLAEVSMVREF